MNEVRPISRLYIFPVWLLLTEPRPTFSSTFRNAICNVSSRPYARNCKLLLQDIGKVLETNTGAQIGIMLLTLALRTGCDLDEVYAPKFHQPLPILSNSCGGG